MKKENKSIIFSSIALFGVLLLGGLWLCGAWHPRVVTLDTFIGVIATLIGIMVTFAIGWQIVNAMALKSKIAELEQQKAQIDELRQQVEGQSSVSKAEIGHLMGISAKEKGNNIWAFTYFLQALYAGILTTPQYAIYVSQDLYTLAKLTSEISPCHIRKEQWDMLKKIEEDIKKAPLFSMIQSQFDAIMSDFYKKVSYEE